MQTQITLPPEPRSGYVKVKVEGGYRYEQTEERPVRIDQQQQQINNMKITLIQCAADLDPENTTSDPDASLDAYIAEVSSELRKEFPDCEIEHSDDSGTYSFRLTEYDGDDYYEVEDTIQRITETVYETGNFWK
jgi:hypothetical protein